MFATRSITKRWSLLRMLFKPEIYPEAFSTYFHRLPNNIEVSWFRDDGMIIGTVKAGDKEFMTQGIDADDFIRMVNQSIVTVFNIPDDYFDAINRTKTYQPTPSERALLSDMSVASHHFGLAKNELAFRLA